MRFQFRPKANYHTHTTFCDGENTPEEMVQEALRLGCWGIGFSGHSYTPFDESCCMSREGTKEYKACIRALQKKYAGKIDIALGVEQDYYSEEPTIDYDYIIGAVHYVKKGREYLPVDESAEKQIEIVDKYYNGDFYGFVEDYYRNVADLYNKTGCDIVGHFDLITKYNEGCALFDTAHPRYRDAAEWALEELTMSPVIFEINTGAMARGCRTEPYPEKRIIGMLLRCGIMVMKNSDAHCKEDLMFGL